MEKQGFSPQTSLWSKHKKSVFLQIRNWVTVWLSGLWNLLIKFKANLFHIRILLSTEVGLIDSMLIALLREQNSIRTHKQSLCLLPTSDKKCDYILIHGVYPSEKVMQHYKEKHISVIITKRNRIKNFNFLS